MQKFLLLNLFLFLSFSAYSKSIKSENFGFYAVNAIGQPNSIIKTVKSTEEKIAIAITPEMTFKNIQSVKLGKNHLDQPEIVLTFNEKGKETFSQLSRKFIGRRLAILIKNEIYIAPRILEPISGGKVTIKSSFTLEEAKKLVMMIENHINKK